MKPTPLVLIGGIDPSGGAGLFADARVAERLGHPYRCIPTAITSQTHKNFFAWEGTPAKLFRSMLAHLDFKVTAVKIGMVGTTQNLEILTRWLHRVRPRYVVWDPVIAASSGGRLMEERSWNAKLQGLWDQCGLVTPNGPEARFILGPKFPAKAQPDAVARALGNLSKIKSPAILLKGGHLTPRAKTVWDYLLQGNRLREYTYPRSKKHPRGTGCTLATALLAHWSRGGELERAYTSAHRYLIKNLF